MVRLFALAVVAGLGVWAYRWWAESRVEAIVQRIRDRGEPANVEDLIRFHGATQADEALAAKLTKIRDMLDIANKEKGHPFHRLAVVTHNSDDSDDPVPPKPWTQIVLARRYLKENAEGFGLLHQTLENLNPVRLPFHSKDPEDILSGPVVWRLPWLVAALRLETTVLFYDGKQSQAVDSLLREFRFSRLLDNQPGDLPQLSRRAEILMALSTLTEWLQSIRNDADLARLDVELASIEFSQAMRLGLVGERATELDYLRERESASVNIKAFDDLLEWYANKTWSTTFAAYANETEARLEAANLRWSQMILKLKAIDAETERKNSAGKIEHLRYLRFPSNSSFLASGLAGTEGKLSAARAAVAVERFKLANGKLPNRLEDLVPRFLASVPIDPFNDKPQVYKIVGNTYRIYSVGPNGIDDGGIDRDTIVNGKPVANLDLDIVFEPLPHVAKSPPGKKN